MDPAKYAHREDEQRFLVERLPDGASEPRLIEDRYLAGTRLRVRTVSSVDGVVRKLGHKVPVLSAGPSVVWHTTMYLDDSEATTMLALPGHTLTKRRWTLPSGTVADEFVGSLEGLVLVEGDRPAACPPGGVEVTDDERFCGGSLATLDDNDAVAFVAAAHEQLS